jgi:acetolactate synthase I/II/III large subunit
VNRTLASDTDRYGLYFFMGTLAIFQGEFFHSLSLTQKSPTISASVSPRRVFWRPFTLCGTRWAQSGGCSSMGPCKKTSVNRRAFLKNAVTGAAVLAAAPAAPARPPALARGIPAAIPISSEAELRALPTAEILTANRTGSDFMVDVIKSLGIEYVCANPGSSFRGLHESIINYGGNRRPEFITCCHEESSVGMSHGYAKVEGKPLLVMAHGTVGLQHATMAVYNAYCDRVPILIIGGNLIDATKRISQVEWTHSVQDAAAILRDYVKWDDLPVTLPHFAESTVRAYKMAMTPPMMPVLLIVDGELQENPIPDDAVLQVPKLAPTGPPQGDSGSVDEAARLLVAAENPVLIAGRAARTPAGMTYLMELAETLQIPVIDQMDRMNFPTRHPLNQTERGRELVANADVILGLEVNDFWGAVHSFRDQMERTSRLIARPDAKTISINSANLFVKSNYQNFQRYSEVDFDIPADAEATMPSLSEAVKRHLNPSRKSALATPPLTLGTPALSALRASLRNSGLRLKMKIGRSSPRSDLLAAGLNASGLLKSITITSATRAATASATTRPPRSVPPWPIESTAASASIFNAMAT